MPGTDDSEAAEPIELTDEEREIRKEWIRAYIAKGNDLVNARNFVDRSIQKAIRESREDGPYYLPSAIADLVLAGANPKDEGLKYWVAFLTRTMELKRRDGMTDDDFSEYWSRNPVQRGMERLARAAQMSAFYDNVIETGGLWGSDIEARTAAEEQCRLWFPALSYEVDKDDQSDPHRHLPYEVANRVGTTINSLGGNYEQLEARLKSAGSMNALYRQVLAKNAGRA
jgi:hypothetical protein